MKVARNYNIDVIRGLLLFIMTIDHFSEQTILYNFGYFSAADGFVFISGLVMGSYGMAKYESGGFNYLSSNLTRKSLRIYKYHLIAILSLLVVSIIINYDYNFISAPLLKIENLFKIFWSVVLVYKPMGLDILPMYIFFTLISPLIIQLITKQKIKRIIFISGLIWGLNNTLIDSRLTYWLHYFSIPLSGAFSILSWQFIFILGIISSQIVKKDYFHEPIKNRIILLVALISTFIFLLSKNSWLFLFDPKILISLAKRDVLGPMRLLNFLSFACVMYFVIRELKLSSLFKPFALLGQYSIQVFSFHLVLFYLLRKFVPLFNFEVWSLNGVYQNFGNNLINWVLTIPISLLLFIPIFYLNRRQLLNYVSNTIKSPKVNGRSEHSRLTKLKNKPW